MKMTDLSSREWGCLLWVVAVGLSPGQDEDIRGPKDPIEIPVTEISTPWWVHALFAVAVLSIIVALVWWLGRKNSRVEVSAGDQARKELALLGREGDLMPAPDFAAAVSGVLRVFIERRFGLAAPRRTTEEFLLEIADNPTLRSRQETLQDFLRACDRAKFGSAGLDAATRGELMAKARAFVDDPFNEANAA